MLIYQMLQNKIRDYNLNQSKEETENSFYESGCIIYPIFGLKDKISTKTMKFTL